MSTNNIIKLENGEYLANFYGKYEPDLTLEHSVAEFEVQAMKVLLAIEIVFIMFSPIIGMLIIGWLLEKRRLFKIMKKLERRIFQF